MLTAKLWILFGLVMIVSAEKILGRAEPIPTDTCGSSVVSSENGKLFLFSLSQDSVVWYKSEQPEGWSKWKLLAGKVKMTSGPKPIRYANGTIQVFARGVDRRYYVSTLIGEVWSEWDSPFGDATFVSPPVPIVSASGSCLLFGISTETHSVWLTQSTPINSDGMSYSPWVNLGGNATSSPSVLLDSEAFFHVFIRGPNRALWHLSESYSDQGIKSWGSWECLGGVLASGPKIPTSLNGVHLVEVYARAADKALWHRAQTATQDGESAKWGSWVSLGGVLSSGPGVSVTDDGTSIIFVRATDKGLYFKSQFEDTTGEIQFTEWVSLGGSFASTPTTISRADGSIDIFARGIDQAIWHTRQIEINGTRTFTSWGSLGGHTRRFSC
eukprot:c18401_g2_i1.p1 GENE.c18401_g2_i1~~c18401_g2_i1.p1  ORF type:complete len:384 (-),score=187.19 c18401_g2_i1:1061-2212(-)